jgi:hypothetical protein
MIFGNRILRGCPTRCVIAVRKLKAKPKNETDSLDPQGDALVKYRFAGSPGNQPDV